jgi:spoIIIJ-associated protein
MSDQDATTVAGQPRHDEVQEGHESQGGREGQESQAPTVGAPAPEAAVSAAEAASPVDSGTAESTDSTNNADSTDGTGGPAAHPSDAVAPPAEPGGGRSRVGQLEREGEVAADFLEQLLDIADMDGDIEVDVDGDRAAVAIVDSEEGRVSRRLVGPEGTVLDALQELTRLAVQAATGERSRLMLDVAGHRAERRTALVALARTVIEQVRQTGERQAMDSMTAFERKVVHDEVAAAGLGSDSEGVEPHRHVVVLPA